MQKKLFMAVLVVVFTMSYCLVFAGNGQEAGMRYKGNCSGDTDRLQDPTQEQLKDGSCQTSNVLIKRNLVIVKDQTQEKTQTQDQIQDQLKDSSCDSCDCPYS